MSTPTPTPVPTGSPPPVTPTAGPTTAPVLFDFGDAPDPSYPSLLASNGARTRAIDQFWLGNLRSPSVTNEFDAKVVDRDELDDGLETYLPFGSETTLVFRAVKAATAAGGNVYFNLLVDFDSDGRWQNGDWVVRNREVDLAQAEEELIEISTEFVHDTWLRAALTGAPVADSAGDWDGTGEFAVGEVEDYYLPPTLIPPPPSEPPHTPPPTPTYSPTPTPTYSPTPTPSYSPTPTPTYSPTPTSSLRPSPTPSPTFVYTGDFVVVCKPSVAAIVHGQSVTFTLRITSGLNTPPERFRASITGGAEFGGGTLSADPPPGPDGWSRWVDGSTVTYSTVQDPPPRQEVRLVWFTLQSLSTTRRTYCTVYVTHTETSPTPSASATTITTPSIRVEPEIVTLSLVGQVKATVKGEGFTPGGRVDLHFKPPNHPAIDATAEVGTDGRFSLEIHLQQGMPRGTWQVTATDRASGQEAETTFTVR